MVAKKNTIKAVFFSDSGWENHRRFRLEAVDLRIGVAVARPDPVGCPTMDGLHGLMDEPCTPFLSAAEAL